MRYRILLLFEKRNFTHHPPYIYTLSPDENLRGTLYVE